MSSSLSFIIQFLNFINNLFRSMGHNLVVFDEGFTKIIIISVSYNLRDGFSFSIIVC